MLAAQFLKILLDGYDNIALLGYSMVAEIIVRLHKDINNLTLSNLSFLIKFLDPNDNKNQIFFRSTFNGLLMHGTTCGVQSNKKQLMNAGTPFCNLDFL